MLKDIGDQKKKVPGKLSEMEPYDPPYPVAYSMIARGDLVYFWGNGLSTGTAVIAHEKKTPTEGGWVLLQDSTVKEMTAAEFAAADKPKK